MTITFSDGAKLEIDPRDFKLIIRMAAAALKPSTTAVKRSSLEVELFAACNAMLARMP